MASMALTLLDLVDRAPVPEPWAEGEKIPWDESGFSQRMLAEHLSQDHDRASRRQTVIDRHVSWIHEACLQGRPGRVLDLACGPGFYSQRLAKRGHACCGIDFSPASIGHARAEASREGLSIDYIPGDIRRTEFGSGYDLVLFVFGEFNVFRKADALGLLERVHGALNAGGCLLLEPQTHEGLRQQGQGLRTWHSESSGLFSTTPHVLLNEHFWHADREAATVRHYVLDAVTGKVARYASTAQAYRDAELDRILTDLGFTSIKRFPSLSGGEGDAEDGLVTLLAYKEH